MARVKVQLADNVKRVIFIDPEATKGAVFGVNFFLPSGALATAASFAALLGVNSTGGGVSAHRQLSGLNLGDDHPMYTRKDTLTTRGDLYARGASTVGRLALGTSLQILRSNGTDPVYATISPTITLSTDATGSVILTNLASGTIAVTITANAVTNAKFRQSAAVSVVGRSANSAGDVADISAASDDTVLRRTGATLNFGQLTVGMFTANLVTYAKIQQVSATSRILGRATAGAGNIEELTPAQVQTMVPPKLPNYLVAALPAGALGDMAIVTDAVLTSITGLGLAPTGGGANKVPVYHDGAQWLML